MTTITLRGGGRPVRWRCCCPVRPSHDPAAEGPRHGAGDLEQGKRRAPFGDVDFPAGDGAQIAIHAVP